MTTNVTIRGTEDDVRRATAPERLKLFVVGRGSLREILSGRARVARTDIPDDAEIVNVSFDAMRNALVVAFRSREFDPVPFGDLVPAHPALSLRFLDEPEGHDL